MESPLCSILIIWIFIYDVKATPDTLKPPEQIHISYGDTQNTIVVMWSSRDQTDWLVHYGKSETGMRMSAKSSMAMLPPDHYHSALYVYKVELKNLDSGSQYFYKIVSKHKPEVQSSVFTFKTMDPKQDSNRRMRFVVYGDMGSTMSAVTVKAIQKLHTKRLIDSILHVGDFAYDLDSDGGKVGDDFMNEIQPLASTIPYMTAPGNHEIPGDFQSYRTRFSSPGTNWPIPLNKMWYSFDVGLVHFISYSTEVFFTYIESYVCEQIDWLRKDLEKANNNRNKTPWVIAFGHRPMYCSNSNGDDCTDAFMRRWVKEGLEPLFNAFGVDLILQAHEHSYERLYPLMDGVVERFNYRNPRAPVHVTSGAAGSYEMHDHMKKLPEYWSAFRASEKSFHSFGVLEILNRTHLNFSQIEAIDGSTLDSFVLQQDHHGPFIADAKCDNGWITNSYCSCVAPLRNLILNITIYVLLVIAFVITFICLLKRYVCKYGNKQKGCYYSNKYCFNQYCKKGKYTKLSSELAETLLLEDDHEN